MLRSSAAPAFHDDLAALAVLATAPTGTAPELAQNLSRIYQAVFNADLSHYDAREVYKSAPQLLTQIFDLRMRLRARLSEWHGRGHLTPEVRKALRDVFRVARYAADMLGEIAIGHDRTGQDSRTYRGFAGDNHNTLVNAPFRTGAELSFRSGDVILMRGMHHNSAAIARIGDVDSQFSHIGMVYVGAEGRRYVVESLIEDGAVINPLEHVLDHGLGRAALYRHKDADLAKAAAECVHARVERSQSRGRRILYDFSMRLDGYSSLFCSKLVRLAFDKASNGRIKLPTYPTRLDMRNSDFFHRVGVKATETFAPADIDLEPDFDLVAEWQDYRVTSNLRLQDMVMTKFFEWMERESYRFKEDLPIVLISVLGRLSSLLSDRAKTLISSIVPKVPINMPRRTVAVIAMLHKTAEPIYRQMQQLEKDYIQRTGHGMHGREILEHLERIEDASNGRIGYLVAPRWW